MRHAAAESPLHPLTDADIARRITAGDRDALRLLMKRHNQLLYRTARAILKDDFEAEDAVQEAYLQAYRAMARFRADAKLSTWLVRIVVNESFARLRKRRRGAEVIRFDGETDADSVAAELDITQSSPEPPDRSAQRAEARRLLEAKIDELPEVFRVVFMLRAVEEMTTEETAAALGIPEATVRTRFFRARAMLRDSLAREFDVAVDSSFTFAGARCARIVAAVLARLSEMLPKDA